MIELAGLVILVGLIAYAFGEHIARAFVAAFLAVCAVGLLFVVSVAVLDMRRQAIVQKQRDVHMLPNSWTADERAEMWRCVTRGIHLDRCGAAEAQIEQVWGKNR